MKVIEVKYTCRSCKETDVARYFEHEAIVPAVNCWNCGTGRKFLNAHEQLANQVGMIAGKHVA